MKVSALNVVKNTPHVSNVKPLKMTSPISVQKNAKASALEMMGIYNKSLVNFKGYYGDQQPAKNFLDIKR